MASVSKAVGGTGKLRVVTGMRLSVFRTSSVSGVSVVRNGAPSLGSMTLTAAADWRAVT